MASGYGTTPRKTTPSSTRPGARGEVERLLRITAAAAGGAGEAVLDRAAPETPLLPPQSELSGTARRIHEAALVLFGQRGYHAVSVREIATEVGVKPSSIYAHVASKEDLLAELVRTGHEEHRDALRAAMLEAGSRPEDQLAALTRAHVLVHAAYPLLTRVCNRELRSLSDEPRARVLSIRLESERLLFEVIERGQRLGQFALIDAVLAVAAIGAMGMRVADWWHPGIGIGADAVADTYAGFALRLVSAAPSA